MTIAMPPRSAARRSWGPTGHPECGAAEESEDPLLCDPGFRRVCLCREEWANSTAPTRGRQPGTASRTTPTLIDSFSVSSHGEQGRRHALTVGSSQDRLPQDYHGSPRGQARNTVYTAATAFFLGLERHHERITAPNPVATATNVTENASIRRIAPRIGNHVNAAAMIHRALKARIPV